MRFLGGNWEWRVGEFADRCSERAAINKQLIQDLCDLIVPATSLGYTNFDEGIVGLAGTVSSLIGVQSQWKKTA